ncbi:MAG: glycosyltransferase [Chloroflexi bacterium]|nr:glycosyltransferase [Chloroflexota bacterium]
MSRRIRVLQIVASSRGGGAELLRCLVKGLDPAQFESVVIMPDDGGHVGATDFKSLNVPLERFAIDRRFSLGEFLRLRRFVRNGKFDLVHVHGARAALWGRLATIGPHRPRIAFGVHGLSIVHYAGVRRALLVGIEKILRRTTDATLCDSNAERADVLIWNIAAANRTHVVWNGIDIERVTTPPHDRRAARNALNYSMETPVLATVCRLNKPRDFETLLAGMAQIVVKYPDAQLLIVGDGPLRPQVEALIEQHRLARNVQLLGLVRDVGEVLAAADMFLLITAGWEGLPLAALEAMAMCLPVVISDVGGNREAVIDGETGFVIPPRDVETFVRVTSSLLNDPGRAKQMGNAGAARVQKYFDLRVMAAQVAEIYRSLLK